MRHFPCADRTTDTHRWTGEQSERPLECEHQNARSKHSQSTQPIGQQGCSGICLAQQLFDIALPARKWAVVRRAEGAGSHAAIRRIHITCFLLRVRESLTACCARRSKTLSRVRHLHRMECITHRAASWSPVHQSQSFIERGSSHRS